jgi:DNA-binding MarR family transcriptional regulator
VVYFNRDHHDPSDIEEVTGMTGDEARDQLTEEVTLELGELRVAADRLDEVVARQFGLNRTDLRCAVTLYRHGRMTAGDLADETGLSPGAITNVLDRMERAGYANRVADPDDRRRVVVTSTAATRELGARIYGEVEVVGRSILESQGVEQLTALRDFLRGMRELYERQAGEVVSTPGAEGAEAMDAGAGGLQASAPLAGLLNGRLQFTKGAGKVTVRGDAGLTDLYRASFEGQPPDVSASGGVVTIQQRRRFRPFDWRRQSSEVTLNATIPWSIVLRGGMWKLTADLRPLRLESLEIAGGASDIEIWLPAPAGVVPVKMSGGASEVMLHRPRGTAVRAVISGGASQLVFDGQRLSAVGGRNRLESTGFDDAVDRYEMRFSGGASQVVIDQQ